MKSLFIAFLLFGSGIVYGQVIFQATDRNFFEGDTIKMSVRVFNFSDIAAFQFALRYDSSILELTGVELPDPTPIPMANLGDSIFIDLTDTLLIPDCIMGDFGFCKKGEIRVVWIYYLGATTLDSSEVFTFYFVAQDSGRLSEVVELDKGIIAAVAYDYDLNPFLLEFEFVKPPLQLTSISEPRFKINAFPNPFIESTNIVLEGNHNYSIYHSSGQLIQSGRFTNSFVFEGNQSGMYFIHVEGSVFKIVKM